MKKRLVVFVLTVLCVVTPIMSQQKGDVLNIKENSQMFPIRGFHLDLRIQIMKPEALMDFADELASFGINTLIMEWEATYPFKDHATISNAYSYSREEVQKFIQHCDSLGIQVIPLQQSFGHIEYILRHDRYSELREDRKDISQLCPMEPALNKELFQNLFKDLAGTHNSEYIHIGGDETALLGHCDKCSAKVKEEGKSKLFVDHMKMIAEEVIALGKRPLMWADIVLNYPEAAEELPKEVVFIDWNYGWAINHFGDVEGLKDKGFTFWGAPSIRSHPDNWYVTSWTTHLNNQRDFIPYAKKAGYEGVIMTSWSTTGQYGFIWDVGYKVMDMIQIRNTYPLSGFRILIATYAKALQSDTSINPEKLVIEYVQQRFGVDSKQADRFWEYLSRPHELVVNGKPQHSRSLEDMLKVAESDRDAIKGIQPKKNHEEFEHFRLMTELRVFYLKFKMAEAIFNSDGYSGDNDHVLLAQLESLIVEAKRLNERFALLQKDFLYKSEIDQQNEMRNMELLKLYERVKKKKMP